MHTLRYPTLAPQPLPQTQKSRTCTAGYDEPLPPEEADATAVRRELRRELRVPLTVEISMAFPAAATAALSVETARFVTVSSIIEF
jgi:hypothetical protein